MLNPPNTCTREICKICYHSNAIGFSVSDQMWEVVIPEKFQKSVVCINCFVRIADEMGVEWDKDIKFFPVSLVSLQEWRNSSE